MTNQQTTTVDEMLIDHVVKTAYIGFMLSKEANDSLRKIISIDQQMLIRLIDNYNVVTKNSFYKVKLEDLNPREMYLRTLGTQRYINKTLLEIILTRLNTLLMDNLDATVTPDKQPVVFDINTLQPLTRTGVTTMGKKYHASNNQKYMVHFFHIYNIING